jgi:hypothetical protein
LNARVSLHDEFRAAFEECIVPELRAIQAGLRGIREDVAHLRAEFRPWRRALIAELQRLDARIDVLEGDLRRPISCARASRRRRPDRRRE